MKRIIVYLLLFTLQTVWGQSIETLERQLNRLETQRRLLAGRIDSLDSIIKQKRLITDSLRAVDPHGTTLKTHVAAVFQQSLEKLNTESRLKKLHLRLSTLYNTLYRRITERMDSLKKDLPRTKSPAEQKRIKRELYTLNLRLMEASPELRKLTYNPLKIKAINLAAAGDSLERAIMSNYLQGALREVNQRLQVLEKKKHEIEEMALLESKTEDFLDDIAEGPIIAPQAHEQSYTQTMGENYAGMDAARHGTAQQQVFNNWLTQLQQQLLSASPAGNGQSSAADSSAGYRQLLDKIDFTEQALRSLKQVIQQKLGRQ